MRQRRITAGSGLSTGLSISIMKVRCTASGIAGSGLGTTVKYLHTRKGAAGSDLGNTIKYI
jgi:hypothetical protein